MCFAQKLALGHPSLKLKPLLFGIKIVSILVISYHTVLSKVDVVLGPQTASRLMGSAILPKSFVQGTVSHAC